MKFGFLPLLDGPNHLLLAMSVIRKLRLKPRFRYSVELEAYPSIDGATYVARTEKRAILDLTAEIQARMGDIDNSSAKGMTTLRDQLPPGSRKKSYGRSVPCDHGSSKRLRGFEVMIRSVYLD